jgi:CBS domain-containing protein
MAAIFAGASRALLTSVVFAFEITHQSAAVLPVLCGCGAAYVVSAFLMRHSIMTVKLAQQGVRVPVEYRADELDQILVRDIMARNVISLDGWQTIAQTSAWLRSLLPQARHQGYPIVNKTGALIGVLTRRDILESTLPPMTPIADLIHRAPVVVYGDCTLRDAVDHMINHDIGRLPVMGRSGVAGVVGMITRGDVLSAQHRRTEPAVAFGR